MKNNLKTNGVRFVLHVWAHYCFVIRGSTHRTQTGFLDSIIKKIKEFFLKKLYGIKECIGNKQINKQTRRHRVIMSEGKNIKKERGILKKEVARAPLIDERDIQFGREPKTYKNTQNQNLFLCMLIFFSFHFLKISCLLLLLIYCVGDLFVLRSPHRRFKHFQK